MSGAKHGEYAGTLRRHMPYPAYKDSGVEWLWKIPAHWEVKRLKFTAHIEAGQSPPSEVVREGSDGLPFLQGNADFGPTNPIPRQVCDAAPKQAQAGDILLSVRAPIGAMNVADQGYGIGRGLCAIRLSHIVDRRFGFYALSTTRKLLDSVATGSTYDAVTTSRVGDLPQLLPASPEQCVIAAFLDRETARIDALVAKKERLIELLQEQRATLITRAVTKGLDPTVAMKDSDVEWLGEIPAHWEVKKWRYCCHVTEGQVAPDDDRLRDRILIAPNHIESGTGRILYTETADEQGAISGKYLVAPGDIIYSKIRPALNKVCIAAGDWLCSADMYPVAITEKGLQPRFLLYFMLSEPFVRLMVDESMRVAMPKVNREKLAACPLLIPTTDEQRAIAAFLDRETARIDGLVAKVRDAIDRLKELRTALISAAVTGKIDVREDVV